MNKQRPANKGLNAMGAEVVNSSFVILLSFGGLLNICATIKLCAKFELSYYEALPSQSPEPLAVIATDDFCKRLSSL